MTVEDQVAVFKYGLIAPVINDQITNKTQFFKEAVSQKYLVPGKLEPCKFSWVTLKKWLHLSVQIKANPERLEKKPRKKLRIFVKPGTSKQ